MQRGKINEYIKESASSWLLTRIVPRCMVNKIIKSHAGLSGGLLDLGIYSSVAKVSGFQEYQLHNSRNSTVIFR
jgi:hypothetical protein